MWVIFCHCYSATLHAENIYTIILNSCFSLYRAFAAYEQHVPVDHELEHKERLNLIEYTRKYTSLGINDPLTIPSIEWTDESKGIHLWPKTYFMDISRYFSNVLGRENLWQRLECEYKEGKAYRYYADGFIGELFITKPQGNAKIIVMKTKCVPSQRTSSKQYDVWVAIQNESTNEHLEGEVLNGYCTCTAGLLG